MNFNNKTTKSMDDLHEEEHFEELYNDAAQTQAMKDFIESETSSVVDEEKLVERRARLRGEDSMNDGMDSKWDKYRS